MKDKNSDRRSPSFSQYNSNKSWLSFGPTSGSNLNFSMEKECLPDLDDLPEEKMSNYGNHLILFSTIAFFLLLGSAALMQIPKIIYALEQEGLNAANPIELIQNINKK